MESEFSAALQKIRQARADLLSHTLTAMHLLLDAASDLDNAPRELVEAQRYIEQALTAAYKLDPERVEEEEQARYVTASGTNHDLTEDQRLDMPRTV